MIALRVRSFLLEVLRPLIFALIPDVIALAGLLVLLYGMMMAWGKPVAYISGGLALIIIGLAGARRPTS